MSLVVGLAVMQVLHQVGISQAGVKWPNDVYVDGRKIAGILLALTGDPADVCHVIIGIGIHVNMIEAACLEFGLAGLVVANDILHVAARGDVGEADQESVWSGT